MPAPSLVVWLPENWLPVVPCFCVYVRVCYSLISWSQSALGDWVCVCVCMCVCVCEWAVVDCSPRACAGTFPVRTNVVWMAMLGVLLRQQYTYVGVYSVFTIWTATIPGGVFTVPSCAVVTISTVCCTSVSWICLEVYKLCGLSCWNCSKSCWTTIYIGCVQWLGIIECKSWRENVLRSSSAKECPCLSRKNLSLTNPIVLVLLNLRRQWLRNAWKLLSLFMYILYYKPWT